MLSAQTYLKWKLKETDSSFIAVKFILVAARKVFYALRAGRKESIVARAYKDSVSILKRKIQSSQGNQLSFRPTSIQ